MSGFVPTSSKKSQEELASNYALQVALQTMKERCRQLQGRLTVVEKENLQLKIEKQKQVRQDGKGNLINIGDVDKLHEQVVQLTKTKSLLTHHIYMVATENKYLWTKLSILTEANESLGSRLNKISVALNSHTNKSECLLPEVDYELDNQSLEEISLKLMNNIQQEKTELEHQYAEMVELHSFNDCDITLTNNETLEKKDIAETAPIIGDIASDDNDDDVDEITNDLEAYKQQLKFFVSTMKKQNEISRKSVEQLKAYAKGDEECMLCKRHLMQIEKTFCDAEVMTLPNETLEKDSIDAEVQDINEKLESHSYCPMCFDYSFPTKEELANHIIRHHFPPGEIKDDDRFEKFCTERAPSIF